MKQTFTEIKLKQDKSDLYFKIQLVIKEKESRKIYTTK